MSLSSRCHRFHWLLLPKLRFRQVAASATKLAAVTAATATLPLPTPPPLCHHSQRRTLAKLLPPLAKLAAAPTLPLRFHCRRHRCCRCQPRPRLLPSRCQCNAHRHFCHHASGKLQPPSPLPPCCRRTYCRGAAANDAALPPRCHQAAKLAAAATLPPPLAPLRYRRPAAVLPAAATAAALPLSSLCHCHRRRANGSTTMLPSHPPPCCHRRHANATAAVVLPPKLPLCCHQAAAAACYRHCRRCLCFYLRCCHCCRRCHGIEQLQYEEGEEDKRGSKQCVCTTHCWGAAPPPAPRHYPDFVVGIAQIKKEENMRGRAEAADALSQRSAPPSPQARH